MEVKSEFHDPAALTPENSPRPCPLYRVLGKLHCRSGSYKGEKNLFLLPGIGNFLLDRPARNIVAKPTVLSRLINIITGYIILRQFLKHIIQNINCLTYCVLLLFCFSEIA
jgi:hypothetical protein